MKRFKKKALNQHHKNLNNTTPSPASTAQTKSPANNTHLQTSKPKIKINATADRPPPRYFSMKMFVIVSPPLHPPTTSSKKPDTPHANDNTSSRTAHPPQKAASMPQTSKSIAKPQAKAHEQTQTPQFTRFLSLPMQTGHHLQDICQ